MEVFSRKSVFLAVLAFFSNLNYTGAVLKCYKCTTTKPSMYTNETTRLCSEFDYSDKYIVECPYSTFCMKRYYTAKIPNAINATERDCANQKYITQKLQDGRWQQEIIIQEPYQDGCQIVNDKGFRTSTTEDCYCKGYLCNNVNRFLSNNYLITVNALFVMMAVNLIK